jgi:hypothetical protein
VVRRSESLAVMIRFLQWAEFSAKGVEDFSVTREAQRLDRDILEMAVTVRHSFHPCKRSRISFLCAQAVANENPRADAAKGQQKGGQKGAAPAAPAAPAWQHQPRGGKGSKPWKGGKG